MQRLGARSRMGARVRGQCVLPSGAVIPSPAMSSPTITGLASFTGRVLLADGSAANPSLSFASDLDTGLYRGGANLLGLAAGVLTGSVLIPDGTVALPGLAYASDPDTGLYHTTANEVQATAGGSQSLRMLGTATIATGTIFSNVVSCSAGMLSPASSRSITGAASALAGAAANIEVTVTGGPFVLTSAPQLNDGSDGQTCEITVVSANGITLSDQGTVAGSNLRLGSATRALGTRDKIGLRYSAAIGDWVEQFFNNVI